MRLYSPHAYDFATPVESYWEASAPPLGLDLAPLGASTTADVAVIGAGFTGLHAALRLTREFGLDTVVLDAGHIGWGASGRNGGFCCIGSAKMGYEEMIARFGLEAAREFHAAQKQAVEFVAGFLEESAIDAEATGHGEVELAHKANRYAGFAAYAALMRDTFGDQYELIPAEALAERGLGGSGLHGAIAGKVGFGLHPLRYLRGLARTAAAAGVRLYPRSEVTAWRRDGADHVLATGNGEVRAARVLVATNGYTDDTVPPAVSGRLLPALSRAIVTRPLTDDELAAQHWTTHTLAYDSRRLLHYFRLLPGNRFLFGGRGGTGTTPSDMHRNDEQLNASFRAMFPAWSGVAIDHSWAGLVCLAADLLPHAGRLPGFDDVWLAAAYHGNGVAMASYTGNRIASSIASGEPAATGLPAIMRAAPKRFPLPALRRGYLKAAYVGFALKDRFL